MIHQALAVGHDMALDHSGFSGFEDLLDASAQPGVQALRDDVVDDSADDVGQFLAREAVRDQNAAVAVEVGDDVRDVFEDGTPTLEQSLIRCLGDRHSAPPPTGEHSAPRSIAVRAMPIPLASR
ncbi:MAG: hypothetical protein JRG80_19890 [Deltaproteobacteria bacterium]|nr:hypothetical protein [Deltaproteobacteria bacterium]